MNPPVVLFTDAPALVEIKPAASVNHEIDSPMPRTTAAALVDRSPVYFAPGNTTTFGVVNACTSPAATLVRASDATPAACSTVLRARVTFVCADQPVASVSMLDWLRLSRFPTMTPSPGRASWSRPTRDPC